MSLQQGFRFWLSVKQHLCPVVVSGVNVRLVCCWLQQSRTWVISCSKLRLLYSVGRQQPIYKAPVIFHGMRDVYFLDIGSASGRSCLTLLRVVVAPPRAFLPLSLLTCSNHWMTTGNRHSPSWLPAVIQEDGGLQLYDFQIYLNSNE